MNDIAETTTSTALALLDNRAITAADVFSKPEGVRAILDGIKAEVAKVDIDISTPRGRAEAKSLGYKVARSKTTLMAMGASLTEGLRAQVAAVNTDRKVIETELDALKAEVLADVTAWEDAEKARVKSHEDALETLIRFAHPGVANFSPVEIELMIKDAKAFAEGRDWGIDFRRRASTALADVTDKLGDHIAAAKRNLLAQAEEQKRLAAEQAEREAHIAKCAWDAAQLEIEKRAEIARDAAEKARIEAEERAAEAAAVAAQEALARERVERERAEQAEQDKLLAVAAQRRAEEQSEQHRVKAHGDAIRVIFVAGEVSDLQTVGQLNERLARAQEIFDGRDWEEFADRALSVLNSTLANLQSAADAREEWERQLEQEAERRRTADQVRIQAEAQARAQKDLDAKIAADTAAAKKRAENVANQRKINREIVEDLVDAMSEVHAGAAPEANQIAVAIVIAMAKAQVRHVNIIY